MTMPIFSYSLVVLLTALLGGAIPLLVPKFKDEYLKLFISLGGGLLLGMALVHMLPESAQLIPHSFGPWFLAGFILLLVLERFVMVHACEETGCDYHTVGITAFVGLAVHSVIEGFALASSLMTLEIGPMVLLAVLVHKAPASFTLTSLLKLSNRSPIKILLFISGLALCTPLGIYLGAYLLTSRALLNGSGILLALSGGTFLYIAACDLIPELHRSSEEKFKRLAAFMAGVCISFLA